MLRIIIAEGLSRTTIDSSGDGVAIKLSEVRHAPAFWQILADEAVGVFVQSAFPRVVWCGEVEFHAGFGLDGFVVVEFGAVVGCECSDGSVVALDEPNDALVELCSSSCAEFSDQDVLGFSLDQGGDAVLVVSADDGVDFPVAESGAIFSPRRAFGDVALACEDATGIVGSIAFSALFSSVPEVGVEVAAVDAVIPDVAIDGLMADIEHAMESKPAGDLLGAPIEAQQQDDDLQVPVGEAPVSPGLGAPAVGAGDGLARPIGPIGALIALEFTGNTRAVASELDSDGALREPLHAQGGNHIPLSRGDLAIPHCIIPLLAG